MSTGGRIIIGYSVQCPNCLFVQSGFDTRKEAEEWVCENCEEEDTGDVPLPLEYPKG